MTDEMTAEVTSTLLEDGAILQITLNRPKANILSMQMMQEIGAALDVHRNDRPLKLVTIHGAGDHFSFGASVPEHTKDKAEGMLTAFHAFIRNVASYPAPIAALVRGCCFGGAFELILACHFVFATEDAKFACPEIKLGVMPPVLAVLGQMKLGATLAEKMLITGSEIDGKRLFAANALTDLIPAGTSLEEYALAFYKKHLAPLSAFSVREATQAGRQGSGMLIALGAPLQLAERRYVGRLIPSHDGNEGIEAFLEKRAPQWTNA